MPGDLSIAGEDVTLSVFLLAPRKELDRRRSPLASASLPRDASVIMVFWRL